MAAHLCDIKPGDEVIMPSYTFVSTADAFVLKGAKIVFVDIRPDTMNIDEKLIEAAVTEKTKVIVPVHYAGVACEMDTIMAIAERHHLLVVEKLWLKQYLDRWPVLGHLYMLVLIPVSWAVFSVSDFGQLGAYFGRLFPLFSRTAAAYPLDFLKYGKTYGVFLILGLLCSTSLPAYLYRRLKGTWVGAVILAVLFWLCLYCLSKGMNDPFMYFRF